MGSHRKKKSSPTLHPCCFFLLTGLVLPALSVDPLLCYFSPLHLKDDAFPFITSECLPDQRCTSSRGHRGPVHVLSARGCVDKKLCNSQEVVAYRGVQFDLTHTCCCTDKCNDTPKSSGSSLKKLLGIAVKGDGRLNNVLGNSCGNSTSSPPPATQS